MNIEGCHQLPPSRNNTDSIKRVIVKFINKKHSEYVLRSKKIISSNTKVIISNSMCPYYCYLSVKCKDLQRRDVINQVLCFGAVVTIKVNENGSSVKIYHENDFITIVEDIYRTASGSGRKIQLPAVEFYQGYLRLGFCGCLGYASGLLSVSLITSRAIYASFSEKAQFCFLPTGLTSILCA